MYLFMEYIFDDINIFLVVVLVDGFFVIMVRYVILFFK